MNIEYRISKKEKSKIEKGRATPLPRFDIRCSIFVLSSLPRFDVRYSIFDIRF